MSGILQNERLGLAFQYFGMAVLSVALVKLAMRLANNIGTFFFGTGAVDFKKYGSWSVITGATDGIGKAYAEQLAKRGQNIVLISRTLAKLEQLAKELEDTYKVKTLVIAADFTEPNSIYEDIKIKVKDLDIGVLINNVGMAYPDVPEYFDIIVEEEKQLINNLINANIMSVTKMTAIVLPSMLAKKKGIIVNNASGSGRAPTALLTIYSASKAYVEFFSRALASEYEDKGIIVQSLCPYFVATKMTKLKGSYLAPSPTTYASSAIDTIGSQGVTNGCIPHQLQGWAVESLMPNAVNNYISNSFLLKKRAAGYKKRARKQAEAQASKKD
jgi:17beta-estradiol 17-dehydrogenase / very-long-chain 3-oxoacyl-CoA reductase